MLISWSSGKLNKKDPSSIVIMTTQVTFTDDVKRVRFLLDSIVI